MAFGFTTYVDPGVYDQEVLVPSGINIPAQPFAVCLVGVGSRLKRVTNERVIRGFVRGEAITPSASAPHSATLGHRATKRLEDTQLYQTLNGIRRPVLDSLVTFERPFVLGTVTATVDLSTNNAISLEMDGLQAVTIAMHDVPAALEGSAGALAFGVSGATVTLTRPSGSFLTAGVRPGHSIVIASAEDAGNNGTFVVTAVTATTVSYVNASGVVNAEDTAAVVNFSGTGFVGREIRPLYNFGNAAAATMTEIAGAVNQALTAATSLGYGAAYGEVAEVVSSALRIRSPNSGPTSDVRVFSGITNDALAAIFGAPAAGNRDAQTVVTISPLAWNANATWTVDYARRESDTDALAQLTGVQRVLAVGSSPGTSNFYESRDWSLNGQLIDWSGDSAAVITGVVPTGGTFDVNPNGQVVIAIDGRLSSVTGTEQATVNILAASPPPLGFVTSLGGSGDAATPAQVRDNINAVLTQHFGPRYASVASVDASNRIVLTSPTQGIGSSIAVSAPASGASALATIFGGALSTTGAGQRPVAGAEYHVSYEYTRPSSEYNVAYRHFSAADAKAQVGQVSTSVPDYNPLAIAVEIAFENGAEFVYTIQVDDVLEGAPTRAQIRAALEGAEAISGATEIVVVGEPGTRLDVTTDLRAHIEEMNGPLEKRYRRLFTALPNNTAVGSRDVESSIIGRATRTMQVAPNSPARGRMFVVAPPQAQGLTRTLVLEDSTEARVNLDPTYLAVACAARKSSLPSAADTLSGRTITGFNTDDITSPWRPAERRAMASQGVMVVSYDSGLLRIRDAVTTEAGGGNDVKFRVDSTSYQKDIITRKVDQALENNILYIVPYDLSTFILDMKLVIASALSSEIGVTIGPYRDKTTGAVRPLNPAVDIFVTQSRTDPTQFNFGYWYNLRYPALRLVGQHSVDNPFFALAA